MTNRVWIYLSDKEISGELEKEISAEMKKFLAGWNAHGQPLTGDCQILHNRFIVIRANETQFAASGCSIDKQVQFVKQLEQKYALNLFDRLLVGLKKDDGVEVVHSSKISELLSNGKINENSLIFNTAVSTEKEFNENFLILLKNSWLNKFIQPKVI